MTQVAPNFTVGSAAHPGSVADACAGEVTARLCVLGSGSRGNCSLLEVHFADGRVTRVLVDVGLSPRTTAGHLEHLGLELEQIDAAIVTHLDMDHCHVGWRTGLPRHVEVFVHRGHAHRAYRSGFNTGRLLTFDGAFVTRGGLLVRPVMTFHDVYGCAAFRFSLGVLGDIGYATDLGRVTDEIVTHLRGVDVLAIESNYCPQMQEASDRPEFLKRRITGGRGHLSNHEALEAIGAIRPGQHVVLLHLSQQCNDPGLVASLHEGAGYRLTIASQREPSGWVTLGAAR